MQKDEKKERNGRHKSCSGRLSFSLFRFFIAGPALFFLSQSAAQIASIFNAKAHIRQSLFLPSPLHFQHSAQIRILHLNKTYLKTPLQPARKKRNSRAYEWSPVSLHVPGMYRIPRFLCDPTPYLCLPLWRICWRLSSDDSTSNAKLAAR